MPFRSDSEVNRKDAHSLEREALKSERLVIIPIITAHQPVWLFFSVVRNKEPFPFWVKMQVLPPQSFIFFSFACLSITFFSLHHKSHICFFHERKTREKKTNIKKKSLRPIQSISSIYGELPWTQKEKRRKGENKVSLKQKKK